MNQELTPALPCALEARDLSVILGGQKVLEIPSLKVLPNKVLVVIGPNGSGKTTLLLNLALLLKPAKGTIFYQGQPVTDDAASLRLRRRFAVVFQEPLLLSTTVWDNVTLGLHLRGFTKEDIKARTQKWLERFGIASLAQRQAKTLSGGEASRTSLARAFALQPEILFLDEPFAALDSPTHQAIIDDFKSVLRETEVTTVVVTHDRNEAMMLGQQVVVLMKGHIRQMGSPAEIFSSPVDEEVAQFVGVENILNGVVVANESGLATININGTIIEAVTDFTAGEEVSVCIRPEDVTLSLSAICSSARNCLAGEVTLVTSTGPLSRAAINCGFPLVVLVTKRSSEELELKKGRQVYATFKATSIHIIKRH